MMAAWKTTTRSAVKSFAWRTEPVLLPPRGEKTFGEAESQRLLADPKQTSACRNNAAFQLAWLQRIKRPIDIACLEVGPVQIVHLPGEPFIEYQLFAQRQRKARIVCVAGYGDGGPGYIPTADAYLQGGYEPTVSLVGTRSEALLQRAMRRVMEA
jgi:hypothetical protein